MKEKITGILLMLLVFASSSLQAEVIDRVAAFVDNEAITLSELEESFKKNAAVEPGITRSEALNTIINRTLLLREAKKLRMEARDEETLLREYIDLKVRAFIRIRESDIEAFYKKNNKEFKGLKLGEVKEKIETYLREKKVNQSLRHHIESLKAGSQIKILYEP
ncbi:MAG: hypothetical protein Q8J64_05430 [Thermodesulfovibrionales bacterium]|nr:hypothetical protein [Thermodesulfovibrionales bacterium]